MYSCCSHLKHRAYVKRFVSLQFLNFSQSEDTLDGGSARRKAATYTQTQNKQNKYLEWDLNPRSHFSSGRRHFMPQTAWPP
jgi:hypothetical protein